MKQALSAFVAGVVFAVGLGLSGMTKPSKVVDFLDFTGNWDPSLMFVMLGAIALHFVLFRLILRRPSPLLAQTFQVPTRRDLTPQLLGGAALFGVGWGLGGFCPGPGLTSIGSFGAEALTFVVAMSGGMFVHQWVAGRRSQPEPEPAGEA